MDLFGLEVAALLEDLLLLFGQGRGLHRLAALEGLVVA